MRKSKSIEEVFQKDIENIQERNTINENYKSIKEYYKEKIKSFQDIQIERVYLEKKLLKYNGMSLNVSMSVLVVIITYFFNIILNGINLEKKWVLIGVTFIVSIVWVIIAFGSDIIREKQENTYYNMCLKILEELEEDFKSKDLDSLDRIKEFHGIK